MTEIMKHEGGAVAPQSVLEYAIAKGVDVETLERLIALQRQVTDNDARMAFHAAMAAFQAEVGPAPKVSKGAVRTDGSKTTTVMYAARDVLMAHIRAPLAKHGLSVNYKISNKGEDTKVACIVSHVLGHKERTTVTLKTQSAAPPRASGVQISGSALEYGMRYSLVAALGLVAEGVDDDGEGTKPVAEKISAAQAADLRALADEVGANVPAFLKFMGVAGFDDLTVAQLADATRQLERKRGA